MKLPDTRPRTPKAHAAFFASAFFVASVSRRIRKGCPPPRPSSRVFRAVIRARRFEVAKLRPVWRAAVLAEARFLRGAGPDASAFGRNSGDAPIHTSREAEATPRSLHTRRFAGTSGTKRAAVETSRWRGTETRRFSIGMRGGVAKEIPE